MNISRNHMLDLYTTEQKKHSLLNDEKTLIMVLKVLACIQLEMTAVFQKCMLACASFDKLE